MLPTIQSRTFCFLVQCLENIYIKIYKTIILPVVLYVCKTWSFTLRETEGVREQDVEENICTEER
jgi:hypothetical protein